MYVQVVAIKTVSVYAESHLTVNTATAYIAWTLDRRCIAIYLIQGSSLASSISLITIVVDSLPLNTFPRS